MDFLKEIENIGFPNRYVLLSNWRSIDALECCGIKLEMLSSSLLLR